MTIDQTPQILALIDRYGLSLVLLVMAIVALVWFVKKQDKRNEEMMAILIRVKNIIPDDRKEDVERVVQLNSQIKGLLREAMLDTKAGWVQLWQFHNGTHGLGKGKIPFMYLSLTNEVNQPELTEMCEQFRELPLSVFEGFTSQLITEDIVYCDANCDNDSGIGKMLIALGAKSTYMRAIRDADGKVIGFVSFSFAVHRDITDDCVVKVRNYAQRMIALLSTFDEEGTTNGL